LSSSSSPGLLCSSADAPPPLLPAMCRAPPPLRCSEPSHVPPQLSATASPSPAGLSPSCHAARPSARATLRRRSPSLQHQRHLLLPVNPTRRSLADRRLNSPLPSSARATLTSPLSELRRSIHACRRPPNIASCALCPL
jgi:hypothetical protein